jgi:SAM-dependent methyltransferase
MLGRMHAVSFERDPKHLGFVIARYHFVARMLFGCTHVLEVGCGDGTGARVVAQTVPFLYGMDIEEQSTFPGRFVRGDIVKNGPQSLGWRDMDGIYALDVLEHIAASSEDKAIDNMKLFLRDRGTLIIGMPSLESQAYASEESKKYHVNCKTEEGLCKTMLRHFSNVYMFGMNDSTLHVGHPAMAHYRLALCTGHD